MVTVLRLDLQEKNLMRTETVKAMSESAENIIILTDSSKFSERGVVAQFRVSE